MYKKTNEILFLSSLTMIVCAGCTQLPELPVTPINTTAIDSAAEGRSAAPGEATVEPVQKRALVILPDPQEPAESIATAPGAQFAPPGTAELTTAPDLQFAPQVTAELNTEPQFSPPVSADLNTAEPEPQFSPPVTADGNAAEPEPQFSPPVTAELITIEPDSKILPQETVELIAAAPDTQFSPQATVQLLSREIVPPTGSAEISSLETVAPSVGTVAPNTADAQESNSLVVPGEQGPESQCPGIPELKPLAGGGCTLTNTAQLAVTFLISSDVLTTSAFGVLDNVLEALSNQPFIKVEVDAHSDNRGNAANNLALSTRRADAVERYLQSKGISKDQVFLRAYAGENPIASNDTISGRRANRRVEIRFFP